MNIDDINLLVREVQDLLINPFGVDESELMDVAGRHEDFVNEASNWMMAVDKLLQKGLRTEAIELAERDPNLNEVIVALDFPEFDAWNELLLKHDMQPISELPEGVAADLNDAYGLSSSLERLMQKHRSAALARAPISARLQILRLLENKDAENPAWPEDIKGFEKARLAEVRSQLDEAIRQADLTALTAIDRELQDPAWRSAVPPELKRRATDGCAALRRDNALQEMQDAAYRLSDAFADFDLVLATPLYHRFNALNLIASLPASDRLFDIAGPALDWVREELEKVEREEHFRQAILNLEAGLEQGNTAGGLERLAYEATRFNHILPERLQHRLQDRLQTLRVLADRRRRMITVATAFAALSVVAMVGFAVHSFRVRSEITRHKTQLTGLMESASATGLMEPLDRYFELLGKEPSSISQSTIVLGLRQQYETLRLQQEGRRQQLDSQLEAVTEAVEAATVPSAFEQIFQMLKDAERLALSDAEKVAILKADAEAYRRRDEVQKVVDDSFQQKTQLISKRIEALPLDNAGPYDNLLSEIAILKQTPEVTQGLLTSLSSLERKVRGDRDEVNRRLEIARDLQVVSSAVGNELSYTKALESYLTKYPGSVRSGNFSRVLETERDLLAGAMNWNRLRQRFLGVSAKSTTPAEAREILDGYGTFLKSSGPYPGTTDLKTRLPILQSIGKRVPPVEGFRMIFGGRAISNAYLVSTVDQKKVFYADSPPIITLDSISFDVYTTPDGEQTVKQKLFKSQFAPDRLAGDIRPDKWLSPQTRLARNVSPLMTENVTGDFEVLIRTVAKRILGEDGLDPILRMLLVERVLEYGAQGSLFIESRFVPIKQAYSEAGVPRLANWLSDSDETTKLRIAAADFIQKNELVILQALETAVADRDALAEQPIGPAVHWIGWLSRGDVPADGWRIRTNESLDAKSTGELIVFGRGMAGESPKQMPIGRVDKTGTILVTGLDGDMVEGRPVYLLRAEN
jgi:hypothetical protein